MRHSQKEEIALAQHFFNAANDDRAVRVANFLQDHANRKSSLHAQTSRQHVGRYFNSRAAARILWRVVSGDRTRRRGIVQHGRNSSGRQADVFRNFF